MAAAVVELSLYPHHNDLTVYIELDGRVPGFFVVAGIVADIAIHLHGTRPRSAYVICVIHSTICDCAIAYRCQENNMRLSVGVDGDCNILVALSDIVIVQVTQDRCYTAPGIRAGVKDSIP